MILRNFSFKKNLASLSSKIELSSTLLAQNMREGGFRSMFSGQGIEFSGVREYLPGDNIRSIDWNVTARMKRVFVKQYEEDREMNIFLILDCSKSMLSFYQAKFRTACFASALIACASERNQSALGGIFFDGAVRNCFPPLSGEKNALVFLSKIDAIDAGLGDGTALSQSLRLAMKILRRRSLVLIFSDFRIDESNIRQEFSLLCAQHDVVAARIESKFDSFLPKIGAIPFVDSESNILKIFPLSSAKFAAEWFSSEKNRLERFKNFCIKNGASPLSISAESDCGEILCRFFASRRRR